MPKKDVTEAEGVVTQTLPDANFKVQLDDGREILAHISGKMRKYHIRILSGDRVKVAMTPYDETRGRIVYRFK